MGSLYKEADWDCNQMSLIKIKKYDKQDRQGKVAFNERSPHPTQQQAQSHC
jgi:hypothetical protein